MGPGTDMVKPLFRKNTLDEMTVGRTEKPVVGKLPAKPVGPVAAPGQRFSPLLEGQAERADGKADPRPIIRAKPGAGSYEDSSDQKRQKRTKGKTGRPGQ